MAAMRALSLLLCAGVGASTYVGKPNFIFVLGDDCALRMPPLTLLVPCCLLASHAGC